MSESKKQMETDSPVMAWAKKQFWQSKLTPKQFYRYLFRSGELDTKGAYTKGKYVGLAIGINNEKLTTKGKSRIYKYVVTDDLDAIAEMGNTDQFCLMSPISYAGHSRSAASARFVYAIVIDLDHIQVHDGIAKGCDALWNGQILCRYGLKHPRIPLPTMIVASGTGLHLYYCFDKALPLYPHIVKQLQKLKHELTELIWEGTIVDITDERDIQQEGIFQGFRVPGTVTKTGNRAIGFGTGKYVTIPYLNSFVSEKSRVKNFILKNEITLREAKEKYPEWYQSKIVEKRPVGKPWAISRRLYDWWKQEILAKTKVGHRYYCLMLLAMYAQKCSFWDEKKNPTPVTAEELQNDAFEIAKHFEEITDDDNNHFTKSDVLDALEAFNEKFITYPRNSVEYRAGFALPVRKRNYRKQDEHLKVARYIRDEINGHKDSWRGNGRKPKCDIVWKCRKEHPEWSVSAVARETKMSRTTVYKWWSYVPTNEIESQYWREEERELVWEIECLSWGDHIPKEQQEAYEKYLEKSRLVSRYFVSPDGTPWIPEDPKPEDWAPDIPEIWEPEYSDFEESLKPGDLEHEDDLKEESKVIENE